MFGQFYRPLKIYLGSATLACAGIFLFLPGAQAQGSGALGNGLSAAAIGRAGNNVAEPATALDGVEGNPAGLADVSEHVLDVSTVGLVAGGSFQNATNQNVKLTGLAGAQPFGAFATRLGRTHWVVSAAVTPKILFRANWHYNAPPGTAGVTYGYQRQETQITATRTSLGLARSFGPKWSAGVTLGAVYSKNELNAPYVFQQQLILEGLKVLLLLTTRGYGWNGSSGAQWQPGAHVRAGLAWKSGTTIHTQGDANGSASALFEALKVSVDPAFHYHAQVMNHLPQAFDVGLAWQAQHQWNVLLQGDFAAWGQAFQQLPIALTGGTNNTINSLVGGSSFNDAVPLHWRDQGAFHVGLERQVRETVTLRTGYS